MDSPSTITVQPGGEYEISPPIDGCDGVFIHYTGHPAYLGHVEDPGSGHDFVDYSGIPPVAPADWETRIVRELPGLPF